MNANLLTLTREKRKLPMKRILMPATALAAVLVCLVFAPSIAVSQVQPRPSSLSIPTSGALLTINGTVGLVAVNRNIYDSQIHTSTVRSVPIAPTPDGGNCNSVDARFQTDAYVLQGGSWTGCDPGDTFETSQGNGTASIFGTGYTFAITTFYTFGSVEVPQCNTQGNICVPTNGPDSGFLTVTNNSGADFTGTISLSGISPIAGGSFCPPNGIASDSFTGTLPSGGSVTLALSFDSSNCGGFNQSQTQTLSKHGTITFQAGGDTWTDFAANNVGGEKITFLPVPTPQSLFHPGPRFAGDKCDPYDDFSEPFEGPSPNPVCVPFLLTCSGNDCSTFSYQLTTTYHGPDDRGTPHFLKADRAMSPTPNFAQNDILSYGFVGDPNPIKKGGGSGHSFLAPTYFNTGVDNTTPASIATYPSNFFPPVANPPVVNRAEAGKVHRLRWQSFDGTTNALITPQSQNVFTLCTNSPSTCGPNTVAIQFVQIDCKTHVSGPTTSASAGESGLQFHNETQTWELDVQSKGSFAGTCQALQLIFTGTGSLQSTHSAFFKYSEGD
jgi:hypothetical protein